MRACVIDTGAGVRDRSRSRTRCLPSVGARVFAAEPGISVTFRHGHDRSTMIRLLGNRCDVAIRVDDYKIANR